MYICKVGLESHKFQEKYHICTRRPIFTSFGSLASNRSRGQSDLSFVK